MAIYITNQKSQREKPMEEYRLAAKTGDLVTMPKGTLAIVTDWDIICAGHVKEVTLFPFTNWLHRFWLSLTCRLRVCDDDINKLTLVRAS